MPVVLRRSPNGSVQEYGTSATGPASVGSYMLEAQGDAAAGDKIFGYANAEFSPTSGTLVLGKNGVDWDFPPGVSLIVTDDAQPGSALWGTDGDGCKYSVRGGRHFSQHPSFCVIYQEHANSTLSFDVEHIEQLAAETAGVILVAGDLNLRAACVRAHSYDAFILGGAGDVFIDVPLVESVTGGESANCFEFANTGGRVHVRCQRMQAEGHAIWFQGAGDAFVESQVISSGQDNAVGTHPAATGTLHVQSGHITSALKDFAVDGGNVLVYPNVAYDPNKVSGTITKLQPHGA